MHRIPYNERLMFKITFWSKGNKNNSSAKKKVTVKIKKFTPFPADINDWGEDYRVLMRELSKR